MATKTPAPDFDVIDHGSITILTPRTEAARDWIGEHIPDDAQRWCGGVVIEHRYAWNIIAGIMGDGLEVA